MTKIQIKKERDFDYSDNKYEIDIRTTKKLTKEEYKTVVDAIESISGVFDPHLDELFKKRKEQATQK